LPLPVPDAELFTIELEPDLSFGTPNKMAEAMLGTYIMIDGQAVFIKSVILNDDGSISAEVAKSLVHLRLIKGGKR